MRRKKANKYRTKQKAHCCCWCLVLLLTAGGCRRPVWNLCTYNHTHAQISACVRAGLFSLTYLFTGESHINANVILTWALYSSEWVFRINWISAWNVVHLTLGDVISLTTNDADSMKLQSAQEWHFTCMWKQQQRRQRFHTCTRSIVGGNKMALSGHFVSSSTIDMTVFSLAHSRDSSIFYWQSYVFVQYPNDIRN